MPHLAASATPNAELALPEVLRRHLDRAARVLHPHGIRVQHAEPVRDGLRLVLERGQGAAEYGSLVVYLGRWGQWSTVVAQDELSDLVLEALGHLSRPLEAPTRRPWHPAQARAMRGRSNR